MQFPTEFPTDFPTARKCQLGEPKPGLWAPDSNRTPDPRWAHTWSGWVGSTVEGNTLEAKSLCVMTPA